VDTRLSEEHETFRNELASVAKDGRRRWIYARQPKGRLYRARTILSVFLVAFLFLAPFITIDGQPLMLLDILHRRFVLQRADLASHQRGQARLLTNLVESLREWIDDPEESTRLPQRLRDLIELAEAELAGAAFGPASRSRARGRAVIDFVAALTDGQAVALQDALSGHSGQLWTDAFVL